MRKIGFLMVSVAMLACSAEGSNPPQPVKAAFDAKFPSATKVTWDKESASEYEAEFVWNGTKCSANFSTDGTWLETETQIATSELPEKVQSSIKQQYPKYSIVEADRIESSKNGTMYEADIKNGLLKKEVVVKDDGTFVK